jgi:hypothetical protein
MTKYEELLKYSNPDEVIRKLHKYLGKDIQLHMSNKPTKKYMIQSPTGKYIHFGQMGYEDYTKHQNDIRRINYLNRATNIKGKWRDDPYSPNNLSINLLW